MYLAIDLGSTNIKVALYDKSLNLCGSETSPVEYVRENGFVEFDAVLYCENLINLLGKLLKENNQKQVTSLTFTGQAESLIVLGKDQKPLTRAISWMDERSEVECEELKKLFSEKECCNTTGQLAILPTWPATKVLWLKKNRPEIYENAEKYLLLKDFVVFYLTGKMLSDMSIATFSFWFDIYNKCYWKKMLDAIGITEDMLPPLTEPCSIAGKLKENIAKALGLENTPDVNVGTLDHFAGMIGTGNVCRGKITLSTGTVMAMATFSSDVREKYDNIAMHYGFLPDTHIMLPVAESGGVSLEWFKKTCMPDISFKEIDQTVKTRERNDLIFLPYLVGTNAPEFDSRATGVFWGLRQEHDAFDMAYAIMEGVSFLLKKNCDAVKETGASIETIIATGGGAKSDVWCQLQADITGLPVLIPKEKEAACLGAAIIGAVCDGTIESFERVAERIDFSKTFMPRKDTALDRKYEKFCSLYEFSCNLK